MHAKDNLRFAKRVRLFETGHVFSRVGGVREPSRLGIVIATAGSDKKGELFYELKGAADSLIESLGITDVWYDDVEPFRADQAALSLTIAGRQANIKDGEGSSLGFIGQVDPAMAARLKLKGQAAVAELDLRMLVQHAQDEREYEPLPKFPAIGRDVSMLVAADVKIARVLETVRRADNSGLVRDVDVMDIFMPTGKEKLAPEDDRHEYGKSIAVRIVFRADDRTLTDEEVTVAEDAIKGALQDELNARIR
jgi:phenylalanyl-tRNA synthetase beta chain